MGYAFLKDFAGEGDPVIEPFVVGGRLRVATVQRQLDVVLLGGSPGVAWHQRSLNPPLNAPVHSAGLWRSLPPGAIS